MKPKTKLQRKILALSQTLSPLSDYQYKEAVRKIAIHIAKYSPKRGYECLDCGHTWTGAEAKKVVCPHCSAKLEVDKTRKRNFCDKAYFAVVTKCQGFQIVRMFFMQTNLRKGDKPTYWICEAFQRWLSPDGTLTIVGRARHWISYYCDCWNWDSDMEIRSEGPGHMITPWKVVGHSSVIPEIKRNGYAGNFHNCSPYTLFKRLLTDNKTETAWKLGQYKMVAFSLAKHYEFVKYWPSAKVAFRHKYQIKDPSTWYDMLDALEYCGKDLRNPKFICPDNLKEAHDLWIAKKRAKMDEADRRRERERQMTPLQRYEVNHKVDEARYKKAKSIFLDLEFVDKEIVVKPLQSVEEFVEEGEYMHHCVFTNRYYSDDNVLIFHALVNGVSIATIEFSLEDFSVLQCRGKYNQVPEHFDRIVSLIKSNTSKIISKIA
ncbi:PcfJ domain-containing protein [Lepagella muris]|uniref:PcfJ-like protein n=1 Tax=Lepagella muris TaxID=3032870 RepID=A0AC61RLD0_9BACT|nr:PcfJ domain-containing protein [Lepagella muris]TGY79068.1 PcfJ-like protein [Lepagella muris]THG52509.1 PcfJ-like protein [Bacteroidales bacterium]TKC54271.1 PcfJ-like protein [Bacteroidales bacterium]